MYKFTEWAKKIKGFKNVYARLRWLMTGEENEYVTVQFVKEAKEALIREHKATLAYLERKIEKLENK